MKSTLLVLALFFLSVVGFGQSTDFSWNISKKDQKVTESISISGNDVIYTVGDKSKKTQLTNEEVKHIQLLIDRNNLHEDVSYASKEKGGAIEQIEFTSEIKYNDNITHQSVTGPKEEIKSVNIVSTTVFLKKYLENVAPALFK